MAKKEKKNYITPPPASVPETKPVSKKPEFRVVFIIITLFLLFAFLLVLYFSQTKSDGKSKNTLILEPAFKKEGELAVLRPDEKDTVLKLDIEIADNEAEQTQGLMFRKAMSETRGMLFIFPNSEQRSFWMKNTLISLDIIYADEKGKIVSVQAHTRQLSEESLPSEGNAKYVVEVVGGLCDKYKIGKGDLVKFKKN